MQVCENVIVTVKIKSKLLDMELPTFLSIQKLTAKIDETLHSMPGHILFDEHCVGLLFQETVLDKNKTLGNYGIWDGSILECLMGKEAEL